MGRRLNLSQFTLILRKQPQLSVLHFKSTELPLRLSTAFLGLIFHGHQVSDIDSLIDSHAVKWNL